MICMMNQTEPHWRLFAAISGIYIQSRRIIEKHLKTIGMTFPQFGALFNLLEQDNITQIQLAKNLQTDANTTMVLCNSMERKKWITRKKDPSDKRVNRILITDQGKQAFTKIYPHVLDEYKIFIDAISEKDISLIMPILTKLNSRISARYLEI